MRYSGMTGALGAVALLVIALAVIVVGLLVWGTIRSNAGLVASSGEATFDSARAWLGDARSAFEEGRRISAQLTDVPASATTCIPVELDRLISHVADLSASAPTAMDARVCRNVGIRSRALAEAMSAQLTDATIPSRGEAERMAKVQNKHADFEVALRDLAEHVDLL